MRKVYATAAVGAVLVLLGGSWAAVRLAGGSDDPFAPCRETRVAGGSGAIGGPFTLISETGEEVTESDVLSEPSLVYFGYTFCPDVCPFDAARNAEAVDILAAEGFDVQPVFVTVDPERDTPEVLTEYTDYMHPEMLGLTGSPEQVRAATNAFKAFSARRDAEDADFYLMDHSVFTYLMIPGHGFVELFRGAGTGGDGVTADEMAERTACFLKQV